ncbi:MULTISPECIES: YlbE family protein [unclassified Candidatus Frackibacter]|uniref:DUF1116 domain-containing protein n=1 Tax=unclassified Candidatus Frackibacter TaxID=2648818 RepID=UPI000797A527|nr:MULTISPECIES: DUF1116 domain-containing protein [unclassified Candidatus Frackibacter]KXS45279.1 MAG: hypothetical protein AWU54_533 [Candidatus Frackibacter sp. T328-2]SDC78997.1 Protein of unknown function [Candidatus Frackibacter sp. WG11]SEM91769.1 Protein of unknown function [Candidatus Frackibacter sp. WG12]SFM01532.1 Protein of unknown function [Candidatus Frackibacter sp. WG13]
MSISIKEANAKAVERMQNAEPVLVDIETAEDVIPGMTKKTILHAGPPVEWDDMCGPMRGAVIGALIYEGLAEDEDEAVELAGSGEITFDPCHHHQAVGPMAGIVSASMPVYVVENRDQGNKAFCTINEGLGKVLRYGAYSDKVIEKLKWIENTLAPALKEALALTEDGINIKNMTSQALHMGDECHNRNKAGSALFIREITPYLLQTDTDNNTIKDIINFMADNEHFYLNISMPACKATMDAAHGIEGSTIITAMARNGVEFGIRVSGLDEEWFTGEAQVIDGLFFPGYSTDDANPDIGDSTISETAAIGGFAMAAAPAIVGFVGGTPEDAVNFTKSMYEISVEENNTFTIPSMGFRGTATGIDVRKVVETGILPAINTGIAHKDPGVGQVGAGLVDPPKNCFEDALRAFAKKYRG